DAVHVGPDDELFGVHDLSDECAGKIGTITTERGDTAVEGRADETGNDRNYAKLVQSGSEQAGAKAFAKRGQPVKKSGIDGHGPALRRYMQQIAGEKFQFVQDLRMVMLGKLQAIEDVEVKYDEVFRRFTRFGELVARQFCGDFQERIRNSLDCRYNNGHRRDRSRFPH